MPIPKLAVTAALMAAQVALTMSQKIKGPRLDELKTTTADYGTPIPRFWGKRKFECPVIWAENLREVKKTSKTKGGKYEEFQYFGTWAVLICDHEIDAVKRLWMDKNLVYQTDGPGPVSVGSLFKTDTGVKLHSGKNLRIYLGTETQSPDPRMEAWCEDRYGANSCPAYRGSAYIVFENIPLEKFGNRIPAITIEAVSDKADAYPSALVGGGDTFDKLRFSPDGSLFRLGDGTWDLATRTKLIDGSPPDGIYAIDNNETVWGLTGSVSTPTLTGYSLSGAIIYEAVCPAAGGGVQCFDNEVFVGPAITGQNWFHQKAGAAVVQTNISFSPTMFFADADNGTVWAVGFTGATIGFYNVGGAGFTLAGPSTSHVYAMDNGDGQFFCWQNGILFIVDKATGVLVSQTPAPGTIAGSLSIHFLAAQPGSDKIWLGANEISTRTLQTIRTVNVTLWGLGAMVELVYDPINHALMGRTFGGTDVHWLYLDRISSPGVQLKDIVDDVSAWCGLTGQDSSALTQTVLGYSVTQGSGKDMIGPLLDIHDVDPRPHDFTVQFVNRGSAPTETLLTENFVRDGDGPRYAVSVQQDTDLPRRITVNFADSDFDQQTNTVISQRPLDAVDSNREETIDLTTYVATASEAQQFSDRRHRRMWNEREGVSLSLTAQDLTLEPADVKTLSLDGKTRTARLNKLTIAQGVLQCEWKRDDPKLNVLNGAAGAEIEGRDPETILIPALTKGVALDVPLIQDADNDVNPLLYLAAGSYGGTWPGAIFYRGDDGTYDDQVAYFDNLAKATWGFASAALPTANPNLWDRGNSLSVTVYGTLTSSTEAAINASPATNLIALGAAGRWELINFATATLTGTSGAANTYTLSGLKRGRRGTEWAVGTHENGDILLLLSGANALELGTDDIGDAVSFKAQTVGRDPDLAPAIDLAFSGATLKPYAPARVTWYFDGTDLQGTIYRRTRVGGAWNGGSTIPLSENSEEYEVDIYNGATLKRTIAVSGASTFTYTAAMASADGIALPTPPTIEAYQLSDAVGRGFALAA